MDWDNVRVFLAVARAGQFVAAAKRLRLDHATVSRRIAALEAALGAKLFDRRTTGAKLTSAGERFLGAAEAMPRSEVIAIIVRDRWLWLTPMYAFALLIVVWLVTRAQSAGASPFVYRSF